MATFIGTAGNDVTVGTTDADTMSGGAGADRLNGNAGNDVIHGEDGNDTLTGDAGNDTLWGGAGNDGFFGGGNDDAIHGEAGTDTMYGDAGNDIMDGGADNDTLHGGTGNDTLIHRLGEGVDTMNGGAGIDKIVIKLATADLTPAVRADLATLDQWLSHQHATAGSVTALAAQATGPAIVLPALGMTLSTFETVSYELDGAAVALADLLNATPTTAATAELAATEDRAVSGQIVAEDTDGDTLAFTAQQGPAHGTLVLDAATGAYTYTPAADYSGADQFLVRVSDGQGGAALQRVDVTVAASADAPTLAVISPVIVPLAQVIAGLPTNDALAGATGNDTISGGQGDDQLDGNAGASITVPLDIASALADLDGSEALTVRISGLPGGATLSAGHDNGDGSWTLGAANLAGLMLTATVTSSFGVTVAATATEASGEAATVSAIIQIQVGEDNNVISGGSGNDTINGGFGDDVIFGGAPSSGSPGSPHVTTAADNDVIHGGDGNDLVYGNSGDDQLFGDAGNDTLHGGKGADRLEGGDGNDTLNGNSGNDVLVDGGGHDIANGSSGDDRLIAGAGDDVYAGGSGFDTLDFSGATGVMTIDVSKKSAAGMGADTFSGIEHVIGSSFADNYKGSSHADIFEAGAGNDTIRALGGADVLSGGAGDDTFVYFKKDLGGVDRITDFTAGDTLDLRDILKGGNVGALVRSTDTAEGTMVSVKIGNSFSDVAMLEDVHGLTVANMLGAGMILS